MTPPAAGSEQLTVEQALIELMLETLEGLAIRRDPDHRRWCWCAIRWDATKPHNADCNRARALWDKLKEQQ